MCRLWFLLLAVAVVGTLAGTTEDAYRLFKDKVYPINPRVVPIRNQSKSMDVLFRIHLKAITDFDELIQKISTTMFLEVKWRDETLAWNESDYGGIKKIYLDSSDTWRPNLAVGNRYNANKPVGGDFVVLVAISDGTVTWYPETKMETFCKVDIELYPFDTQTCSYDFFIWGMEYGEVSLTTYDGGITMDSFHENGEWNIIKKSFNNTINTYNGGRLVKPHSYIYITIKRRPSVIVLTVLLPVALLAFLNVGVFIIPVDSGEKLSFGVTILLSMAVFLSYINSMMPQTSESISYLSIYISGQLVLSSIAVFVTCISLSLYYRDIENGLSTKLGKLWLYLAPKGNEEMRKVGNQVLFRKISVNFDKVCFWIFSWLAIGTTVVFFIALSGMFL